MHKAEMMAAFAVMLAGSMATQASGYEAVAVDGGGSIKATVMGQGGAGAPAKLTIDKDEDVCGTTEKVDESMLVSTGGGVRNAVVYLRDIEKGKAWPEGENATLAQNGCRFDPHVVIVQAGADLDILNNDGILHNVHSYSEENKAFNIAQPKFKKKLTRKFEQPEFIKIVCDAHRWMTAYVVVADHPYYGVTDDSGAVTLSDVPPGDYELGIWHESLAVSTQSVTVKAGETAEVAVALTKP